MAVTNWWGVGFQVLVVITVVAALVWEAWMERRKDKR